VWALVSPGIDFGDTMSLVSLVPHMTHVYNGPFPWVAVGVLEGSYDVVHFVTAPFFSQIIETLVKMEMSLPPGSMRILPEEMIPNIPVLFLLRGTEDLPSKNPTVPLSIKIAPHVQQRYLGIGNPKGVLSQEISLPRDKATLNTLMKRLDSRLGEALERRDAL